MYVISILFTYNFNKRTYLLTYPLTKGHSMSAESDVCYTGILTSVGYLYVGLVLFYFIHAKCCHPASSVTEASCTCVISELSDGG